ncbi:MAG: peptide chain release factor N(5)-glutamine methyltransferase [Firmicutes bacterium]|jgi:release factor glutamine methyltransferase|nr:peptide chain release factor N(5)-glutamine methyltransferase [Bacillota bacterium]MDD4336201.1 peptide chain release factor N(5)-glutamine methyltransferase [Bacillota bacterium]MDD4792774.1 peptide chain release factor N(5)-glutamine methyltransferase [Bacillota bacterium]
MGAMGRGRQLLDILKLASDYLARQGVEAARLDAEVLLAHILEMDRISLYVNFDRQLDEAELAGFRTALRRRASCMPVAYITGSKEFMSLDFAVNEHVLIPRPETEILVETVRDHFVRTSKERPRIADIGTGSAAIACSLAVLFPNARIIASDISSEALDVAMDNVKRHGLEGQVVCVQGDLLEVLAPGTEWERVDAIVSNPPYIPLAELDTLNPEISEYEPRGALDGGPDGLRYYRKLAQGAIERLADDGFMALEVGDGQAQDVIKILEDAGFTNVESVDDYSGTARVVVATRSAVSGSTSRNGIVADCIDGGDADA